MRTTKPILLLPVALALLAACGQNAENSAPAAYAPAAAAAEYGEAAANQETAVRADSMVLAQKAEGRQLVVEADIAFKTENTRQTVAEVEKLTLQYGGFIEKSGISASVSDEQTYPQQDGQLLVIRRYGQTGDMTVRLRFEQPEAVFRYTRPDSDAEARQYAPSFWQSAGVMLKQGWAGCVRLMLFAVALWPLWLLAAAGSAIWRALRKRGRRKT